MKTYIHVPLGIALGVLVAVGAPDASAARIKCWTNSEGVRECGNTVPPEYAQQGHETKSKTGLTVDKTGAARDPEEVRKERIAKMKADRAARDERRRQRKQAVEDRVLLDSFASEDDVQLQHEQKIGAIDSRINHSRDHIGRLEETLGAMQKVAADEQRAGKEVSDKLLGDIADVQRQIEETEAFIEQREQEKVSLTEQYEKNIARFRFLKAGGAIGAPVKGS